MSDLANFINAGTGQRVLVALQIDGMMRAAGRPSFLQAKDSGRVAAARTLAQGAGHRITVAWTRRHIVAMPDEYAARQENK